MKRFGESEDPRRRLLLQALAAGLFSAGVPGSQAQAQIFGRPPEKLPPGQSIYRLTGDATVNGSAATMQTSIGPNDTVETGRGSEIVFAVGENAFILRDRSRVTLEAEQQRSFLLFGMRLLTGALLSVFPTRGQRTRITTATATIGIRGTGFYLESDPEQTYFCTCYGVAEVEANKDPESKDTVVSKKHDRPLYIVADAKPGESIRDAPFINHTDQELMLIETLVGRVPPYVFPRDSYRAPRRQY
jgi:hypothetical protein